VVFDKTTFIQSYFFCWFFYHKGGNSKLVKIRSCEPIEHELEELIVEANNLIKNNTKNMYTSNLYNFNTSDKSPISSNNQPIKISSTILALDLGSNTGWAIRHRDTTISSGVASFKHQRFEGGGMIYLRFKQWLTAVKNSTGAIDAVYFEEVRRHLGTNAAHAYGGFMAHLTAWCEHHNIPYQGVPVGTIKKHIAGKGNASKQEVMAAIRAKGFEPEDDNEADALALLDLVLNTERED